MITDHAANNTIGPDNVISGNNQSGIQIEGVGSAGNIVTGNYIGTNSAGDDALVWPAEGISVAVSVDRWILPQN